MPGVGMRCKEQVAQGVLVGTVDDGLGGKLCKSLEGAVQLCRRATEESATAGGKEGVAAKETRGGV